MSAGTARASQTSIFSIPDAKLLLMESIRESKNEPLVLVKIFNNKPLYYSRLIGSNYFSYLSFNFLFVQTTAPVREVVSNFGFLYLSELPFLLLGVYEIIKNKIKWGVFVLGWTLLVPLVLSPFILESPNIHRYLLSIFPLELIVAYGIVEFLKFFKKIKIFYRIVFVVIICAFTLELSYFWQELFIHQPIHQPWDRDYPYKQLIYDLKSYEKNYKKIVIETSDTNVYMFYLFYNKYDPVKYQASGSHGNEDYNSLGKYTFVHIPCATNSYKDQGNDALFVDSATCGIPVNYNLVETINWGDGSPALYLLKKNPQSN